MSHIPFGDPKYKEIEAAYRTLQAAPSELKEEFFALWLDSIKEAVNAWGDGTKDDTKLNPFVEKAEIAEGMLCQLFGRLTGYVAHDFLKMYAATHPTMGRERLYSQEDNVFFAVFLEELVTRGSSLTQAIELLYRIWDTTNMSPEGLRKQMRDAYKEARTSRTFWDEIGKDRLQAILIIWLRDCMLDVGKDDDEDGPFVKVLNAYRSMNCDLLTTIQHGYPKLPDFIQADFPWLKTWVEQETDDPIAFIRSLLEVDFSQRTMRVREIFNCYMAVKSTSEK